MKIIFKKTHEKIPKQTTIKLNTQQNQIKKQKKTLNYC